jgi:Tfp pilus assembly protein PilN
VITFIEISESAQKVQMVVCRRRRGRLEIRSYHEAAIEQSEDFLAPEDTAALGKALRSIVAHAKGDIYLILNETQVKHRILDTLQQDPQEAIEAFLRNEGANPEEYLSRFCPADSGTHHFLTIPEELVRFYVGVFEGQEIRLAGILPRLAFLVRQMPAPTVVDWMHGDLVIYRSDDRGAINLTASFLDLEDQKEGLTERIQAVLQWGYEKLRSLEIPAGSEVYLNRMASAFLEAAPGALEYELIAAEDQNQLHIECPDFLCRDFVFKNDFPHWANFYTLHLEARERRHRDLFWGGMIIVVGLIMLLSSVVFGTLQNQALDARLKTINSQVRVARYSIGDYDRFQKIRTLFNQYQQLLGYVQTDQPDWSAVMRTLGETIPSRIVLREVEFLQTQVLERPVEGKLTQAEKPALHLKGLVMAAESQASGILADFLDRLEESPYFTSVFALKSELKKPRQLEWEFTVTLAQEKMVKY